MNLPGGWELVLVVIVIMVLFGAKRLPDASRSLGRSMRIFKAETKGLRDDDDTETTAYDAREHDRQVNDRRIDSPPFVPSGQPVVNGESTDPAQPRQP